MSQPFGGTNRDKLLCARTTGIPFSGLLVGFAGVLVIDGTFSEWLAGHVSGLSTKLH